MKLLHLIVFVLSFSVQAQFYVNGVVRNSSSNSPIPFASIQSNDGQNVVTDSNGKFNILVTTKTTFFKISFEAYYTKTEWLIPLNFFYSIYLIPKQKGIQQIATSSSEFARTLITKVIASKNQNDPLQKLGSFQFKRYTRLIVTANPDSIIGKIDSIFAKRNGLQKFKKMDSSDYKFKKIITQHHLFEAEKVSQFQYNKVLKETVLATKVAGLNEPIYEFMGFSLQSFSIYNPIYQFLESKYDSPISKKGLSRYKFQVIDSIEMDKRSIVLVYFKNKLKSKSNALEGILYIDTQNFAIAKAELRTKGVVEILGIHDFKYFENEQIWFPVKKVFKISKGKNKEDISLLGGTIEFKDDNDNGINKPRKTASDFTYLLAESTNNDFEFNTTVAIKKRLIAIEINADANIKPDYFWNKFRADSLDFRGRNTYTALDSISILNKIEKRLFFGRKIIKGLMPYYFFDLDLKTLLSFNNFEGFRIGLGGTTNERFSKIFRTDGYLAYGLKDLTYKYHFGIATRVGSYSNSWLGLAYTDDLNEIASSSFLTDKKIFRVYTSQPVSTNTFYSHKSFSTYFETRLVAKIFSVLQLTKSLIEPKFDYAYLYDGNKYKNFDLTTASLSIQWSPFSDFMQSPRGKLEIEKRYPKFTFQFTQTIPKFFSNDFAFTKFDFRTEWAQKHLNGQKTTLLFTAGYAIGDLPLTHLYSTAPNCLLNESLFRRFLSITTNNSFETMYFNEFFSDKYFFLQGTHTFKRIKFSKLFGTSIALLQRVAWGNLNNRQQHIGIPFKTLDQGFYESGLEFNQIFKGFGIGSFYRYGPNGLPGFYDNFAIKASFVFDLGI